MFERILQLILKKPFLQNIRIIFFFFDEIVLKFIKKPKKEKGKKRILIVFPLALGDAIMMHGSLETLRNKFPTEKYKLDIICQAAYRKLFEPYFDEVIAVDMRKANVSPKHRIVFLKQCRKYYYDMIFDPTGTEECTPGVYAVNAAVGEEKIGVLSNRDKRYQLPKRLRERIFSNVIWKEEKSIHKVRYYAEVFSEFCKREFIPRIAELNVNCNLDLPPRYIVVFPSASTNTRKWPIERFVEVTEKLVEKMDCPVVICGTEQDRKSTTQFEKMLRSKIEIINYVAKTNIEGLIEVIGRSSFVLTNDTSVYHIAIATGRKTCCVTGDCTFKSFVDYLSEGLVSEKYVRAVTPGWGCGNCENNCIKHVEDTYPCVLENSVSRVWSEIEQILGSDS